MFISPVSILTATAILLAVSFNYASDSQWTKALQLSGFVLTASVICHALIAYTVLSHGEQITRLDG